MILKHNKLKEIDFVEILGIKIPEVVLSICTLVENKKSK
jgi:hypothetical protein